MIIMPRSDDDMDISLNDDDLIDDDPIRQSAISEYFIERRKIN